jgi:molybdopterin-guanine dinucleotide biosynthesis protein B
MIDFPVPLLGFSAFSGTGKTTLLSQLLPILNLNDPQAIAGFIRHYMHRYGENGLYDQSSHRLQRQLC